jgi:hypothetical protein
VAPLRALAWLADIVDRHMIDLLVDSLGALPRRLSSIPRELHNGLISTYSLVMFAGVVAGVLIMLGALW